MLYKNPNNDSYPVDFPFPKEAKSELEPQSEMPPWFIVFYEQYIRQRDDMLNMLQRAAYYGQQPPAPQQQTSVQQSSYFDDDVEQQVDPMLLRKLSTQITLIEGNTPTSLPICTNY